MAVISDLGIMKFHDQTKEMVLAEYYPVVTPIVIAENTGFPMDMSRAEESKSPTEELRILREEIDPQRLILRQRYRSINRYGAEYSVHVRTACQAPSGVHSHLHRKIRDV